MIRVGVHGAGGRMGTTVCAAVAADDELELVAAVDPDEVKDDRNGVTDARGREADIPYHSIDAIRVIRCWALT